MKFDFITHCFVLIVGLFGLRLKRPCHFQKVIERMAEAQQPDVFGNPRALDLERITETMAFDGSGLPVPAPKYIRNTFQPGDMFSNRPVVLLIDAHQIPIVLRLIFDPLLDLAFREFSDTLRFDEPLVRFRSGIVVDMLQIIVVATEYPVCGFRISLFGDAEKKQTLTLSKLLVCSVSS